MTTKTKINHSQKMVTQDQLGQLVRNGVNRDQDHLPVIKFFDPRGSATWLISEVDPDDHFLAYGLCDLGFGSPELGNVDLREFVAIFKSRRGVLGIERDLRFKGEHPMSVYADAAQSKGCIVDRPVN